MLVVMCQDWGGDLGEVAQDQLEVVQYPGEEEGELGLLPALMEVAASHHHYSALEVGQAQEVGQSQEVGRQPGG